MKLKTIPFAAIAAVTIAAPLDASTVLLTDNFNGAEGNQRVDGGYAADQGGTLGSVSYSIGGPGNWWNTQRGNGGNGLAFDDGRFSLNRDFATDANSYNQALQISFDANASGFTSSDGWGSFTVGSAQNIFSYEAGSKYGFIFRQSENLVVGSESINYGSASDSFTILLTDTAGTGSAFNGNGSVAKLYLGGNLLNTTTLGQLGIGDGYLSFGAQPGWWGQGYGVAVFDNLAVSVVPEPQAALLGGIGALTLLLRKRSRRI